MILRASDLIGCVLQTESGERLGRVHDLRAEAVGDGWKLIGLVVGRGGMAARLIGTGSDPLVRGDLVPWQALTGLKDGVVIIRDGQRQPMA